MLSSEQLKKITVSGRAFERGFQYGNLLKNEINTFLSSNLAHINLVRNIPINYTQAIKFIKPYIKIIEEDLPEIAEEIMGLSRGANISYTEAMLLQLRREIIGYELECTSLGYLDKCKNTYIAQNIDLAGDLARLGIVYRIEAKQPNGTSILQYSHVGLLGYMGINSHGIGIGINMVLSVGWKPGVPIYLLIRHLLTKSTIEDCLLEISRIRRASSRSILLTDGNKMLNIEMTVDTHRIIEHSLLLHTNHYLHEDYIHIDRIPTNSSSYYRMEYMKNFMSDICHKPNIKSIKNLLSSHFDNKSSICVHNENNLKAAKTIASVIMNINNKSLLIANGYPCQNSYHEYKF